MGQHAAKYYICFCNSRQEQKATEAIRLLGFQAWYPREKLKKWRHLRRIYYELPLFPRYIFAKFSTADGKYNEIRYCDGVLDILSNDNLPSPVPHGLVESLQRMHFMGLFDRTKAPLPFPPGSDVMLDDDGPFASFVGKVLRARTGDRVEILIECLGKETPVVVPLMRLAKV